LSQYQVGILVFNEVEVLDFSGPFEVFSIAMYPETSEHPFKVNLVAQSDDVIVARNGLKIMPDYCITNAPPFDILIVPGGYGAEQIEIHNNCIIQWIRDQANTVEILASVCTGAFLLAEAGLLDNKKATTHWMDISRLENEYSKIQVRYNVRYVDENSIITSGGISAGLDMSLHIVTKLIGSIAADITAKRMDYDFKETIN